MATKLAELSVNTVQHSGLPGSTAAAGEAFWTPADATIPAVPALPAAFSIPAAAGTAAADVNDVAALKLKKREARKSLPASVVNAANPNHSTLPDRRKSSRPKSIFIERATIGGNTSLRSGRGFGPKIPIAIDTLPPPVTSQWVESPGLYSPQSPRLMRMADARNAVNGGDDAGPYSPDIQDEGNAGIGQAMSPDHGDGAAVKAAAPQSTEEKEHIANREPEKSSNPRLSASDAPSIRSPTMDGSIRDDESVNDTIELSPDPNSASRLRPQSPPKLNRGYSGELAAASPRPASTSPTPQPPSTRTTSTRIGGFLSRMGSIRKPAKSPPMTAQERRNTSQSIASLASNGAESLGTIEDGAEDGDALKTPTLQDQFRILRKQEEQFNPDWDGFSSKSDASRNPIERTVSETGFTHSNNSSQDSTDHKSTRSCSTPGPLKSPPLDPSLPPGTASGLTAGPAEEPRPVDWDLWQTVVYEGPAAVARTSGEELNRAIASGIPAAIRGVVWQVLADSKSPELEELYRTLKSRSAADIDQQLSRPAAPSREASQVLFNNSEGHEKESDAASSHSSEPSERSTPATSTTPPPSVLGEDNETRAKLMAEKAKREAAALNKLEKAIKRDLGTRTSFSKYTQAAGLQDGLFGLCKAYALFDESVGYAQGINFIAMPLLFNMTEEEAFTLLVRLMSKYDVRNMFTGELAGLHLRLYQFERLLEDRDPALYCHLRRRNVGPQLYATQWFLTLFAYRFPLQLVLRVYDLIFSQGLTAILKFGLVLMEHNRAALLEMKDMGQLTNFLKEKLFDVYIDKSPSASSLLEGGFFGSVTGGADKEVYRADEMVRDACDVEISEATLSAYTAEWEETQRQTRERDAELETLRSTNANLTARVKALEDRTQQQDLEHVSIAGDVVRIKVENDKLADENEGLKMRMEELQRLVDTQPAEIEAKFQEEMSRVLERNSEVQSENRVLKEEQEEMEKSLVDIKMKHAQTQQDHDTLTRKWANIQAMLNS